MCNRWAAGWLYSSVVGLKGVLNSAGKIHDGDRPGHAVLSTFSGSASTLRQLDSGFLHGTFSRRGLLEVLISLACSQRVERVNLSLKGCLLGHLVLPLSLKQLRLSIGSISQFSQFYFTVGYAGCWWFQVLGPSEGLCLRFQRKTKGQQLKGKIVSEFFTLSQLFTLFQNFPQENKREKYNKRNRTNRCCTLVVARLSSSYSCNCLSLAVCSCQCSSSLSCSRTARVCTWALLSREV